jgi:hypothetical protein
MSRTTSRWTASSCGAPSLTTATRSR